MARRKRELDAQDWRAYHSGQGDPHQSKAKPVQHPKGMEPGIRLDPTTGRGEAVAVVAPGQEPCWAELLKRMGFADVVEVLDVIEVRAWETPCKGGGTTLLQYVKARVRRRGEARDRVDVDALCKRIGRRKLRRPPKTRSKRALVVNLSDWQGGKNTGGGVESFIERVERLIVLLVARIGTLKPQRLILAGLGDMVEGCADHYAMQTFQVELDRRTQCKLVRRLLVELVARLSPLVPEVVVVCVPGNHGEHRKDGKSHTTWGDNDDVAVFEQVAEICAANPSLKHVSFVVPGEEMVVTLDAFGVGVGFAHGHQCRRGPRGERPVTWWKDMGHADHPVGSCRILVTGHLHHLRLQQTGTKTWMQCPTLDGGSPWWEHSGGDPSIAGTLTFMAGKGCGPMGWCDLEVLA